MTRRWPLLLLALPAGVATWSGWVGLGELTGFGPVKPLPGLVDWTINTAVTLPIGVEAYAAYALHAWLSAGEVSARTRRFAACSAIGSLVLGMLGQVAYHLLATSGKTSAPWQVTTAVACLPVLVLGMGAALGHMLARDAHAAPAEVVEVEPVAVEAVAVPAPEVADQPATEALPVVEDPGTAEPVEPVEDPGGVPSEPAPPPAPTPVVVPAPDELCPVAVERYADEIAEGKVPAVSRLRTDLRIGQPRAQRIRTYLDLLARA
ncbi:hypothetical protein ACFYOK_10845 [Microbispora bryophytorum]|uniref:hypothetical protein n=1 Tax=Microbispora bryophytorum TaxID=1460882 RepID=UPI0034118563